MKNPKTFAILCTIFLILISSNVVAIVIQNWGSLEAPVSYSDASKILDSIHNAQTNDDRGFGPYDPVVGDCGSSLGFGPRSI